MISTMMRRHSSRRVSPTLFFLLLACGVAASAPQCWAHPVMGSIYTKRPQTLQDLAVAIKLNNATISPANYSATPTPGFGSQSSTFGIANVFGRVDQASTQLFATAAAPGATVQVDLRGDSKRSPFAMTSTWGLSKQLTSKWFVPIVPLPGGVTVILQGQGGAGTPIVVELTMVLTGEGIAPQGQGSSTGYMLNAQARTSITNHFGASEFDVAMLRQLGPSVASMGFAGDILVAESAQQLYTESTITSYQLGVLDNNAATDDLSFYVQAIVGLPNAVPGVDPDPTEYWVTFDSTELNVVPEPATVALLSVAAIGCAGVTRRRFAAPVR
jgi:hypothetical protein